MVREPLLQVCGVAAKYHQTQVLWDISLEVNGGEIVALIGANGAGKTTILNVLSGLLRPTAGTVELAGSHIGGIRAERLVRLGVSHVPEGRQVFGNLSVEDNLLIGGYVVPDKQEVQRRLRGVLDLFPRLRERREQQAVTMSGGEQQMLAIGRGLMSAPRLLLLDEPSLGLAPVVVHEVLQALADVARQGTAVLLVEQNSRIALQLAGRAYVVEIGRIALSGDSEQLRNDPRVQELYLGGRPNGHSVLAEG